MKLQVFFYRIISVFWVFFIFLFRKIKEDDYTNSPMAQRFLRYNNRITLRRLRGKSLRANQILVLLPHCLQWFECPIKITAHIENCKKCGRCDIKTIVELQEEFGIHVNVATGGTLARKYLKQARPKVVIAVACERDLLSGITDSFPMPVYGIFNDRINGPCFNTAVATDALRKVLTDLMGIRS